MAHLLLDPEHHMTATDARTAILRLVAERADAIDAGLRDNALYMVDLDGEIEQLAAAYVGLAVTEIATLRAELDGPLVG
jgi:hypothetical protein